METEKLLEKLEPLMPRAVSDWRRTRDTADAKLRTLIDQQIAETAYRVLGDVSKRLLLSLPPEKLIRGEFGLGTILYDRAKWLAGLRRSELLQNTGIFGRSGAGKTNVVFHLLRQLAAKRVPFLFLDWKRTARHLLPLLQTTPAIYTPGRTLSPLQFNPFLPPPGIEHEVYTHQLVDALAAAYTLGDGAKSILQATIQRLSTTDDDHAPNGRRLLQYLEQNPMKGRAQNWAVSAIRALQGLTPFEHRDADTATQSELVDQLARHSTIIELDGLDDSAKRFLIPMLLLWLYFVRLTAPDREQLRLVVVIEEAHHVLYRNENRSKEPLLNTFLRQCREVGIGVIVVDQHPHLISSAALGNTYTSICLNQKDPADVNKAAALSLVPSDEAKWFSHKQRRPSATLRANSGRRYGLGGGGGSSHGATYCWFQAGVSMPMWLPMWPVQIIDHCHGRCTTFARSVSSGTAVVRLKPSLPAEGVSTRSIVPKVRVPTPSMNQSLGQ